MYDDIAGTVVTTIDGGAVFSVTRRVTYGTELWGYVPNFDGYSGWALLDSNVELVRTDTGSRQILIDPDTGLTIGKQPLYDVDAVTGEKTLNAGNASMWVDYAGNLHVRGEISATSLLIEDQTADDYIASNAPRIRLSATRLSWSSENSSMTESGILTCQGAVINGKMECVTEDESDMSIITPSGESAIRSYVTMQFLNGRLNFRDDADDLLARLSFGSEFRMDSNGSMALSSKMDMRMDVADTLDIKANNAVLLKSVNGHVGLDGNTIILDTGDTLIQMDSATTGTSAIVTMESTGEDSVVQLQAQDVDANTYGSLFMKADGTVRLDSLGPMHGDAMISVHGDDGIEIRADSIYLRSSTWDRGIGVDNYGNTFARIGGTDYEADTTSLSLCTNIYEDASGVLHWTFETFEFKNGLLVV